MHREFKPRGHWLVFCQRFRLLRGSVNPVHQPRSSRRWPLHLQFHFLKAQPRDLNALVPVLVSRNKRHL